MARKDIPQALTLERFAAGKDGRSNAFKKKKQANKRKMFEKAQLKRQYAKILEREAAATGVEYRAEARTHTNDNEAAQVNAVPREETREAARSGPSIRPPRRKRKEGTGAMAGEAGHSDEGEDGGRKQGTSDGGEKERSKPRKRKRPDHRPDPFKAAKAIADKTREEAEEKQRERDRQAADKESRAKKRRKQHAMLSKRTKGGQPVMKNTMRYLLEKIQAQI